MDLVALFLHRAFGVALPNYCLVGRWVCHMASGTFAHASIAHSAPKGPECAAGWIAHYAIGVLYALAFVAIVSPRWLAAPTPLPALLFGIVTVLVPFLVMQPSFGQGIAASRSPHPVHARMKSLGAHASFGIGLYVCAAAASPWAPLRG